MDQLAEAGMVYRNNEETYGSVAMVVPKGKGMRGYRLVSDYRAVNPPIEQAAMLMPNLEELAKLFAVARAFCILDLIQGTGRCL